MGKTILGKTESTRERGRPAMKWTDSITATTVLSLQELAGLLRVGHGGRHSFESGQESEPTQGHVAHTKFSQRYKIIFVKAILLLLICMISGIR